MHSYKTWTRNLLLSVALLLPLVGLGNYLVDPYDIYRALRTPGFNANKNIATKHSRLSKPWLVEHLRPRALAFGSSRTEVGIDPGHPGWNPQAGPAFNFALGGAAIEEIAGRFEQAQDSAPLNQAVIGLDFFMFNAFNHNPMSEPGDGSNLDSLDYLLSTLLTVDAVAASFDTLRKQNPVRYPGVRPDGMIEESFNERRVARNGHRSGFQRIESHFFRDNLFPRPAGKYAFVNPETGLDTLEQFRKIITLARAQGIDLKLFISPAHARLLEVIDQAGLWPQFEQWKRRLVEVLAKEAGGHPDRQPFVLWDFSGYNSVTSEEVPAAGDTATRMRYYWESSHYKRQAGDLVLDRLFAYNSPERSVPADFGVVLTPANLEAHLAAIREGKAAWQAAHPQDRAEIAASRQAAGLPPR
ncbi:hypothetical protein DESUT3_16170 [Desulfuromonas versatilis]|uniref:Uncharacterized protein n=1 Tax=Desulfuromonas versatilis TaxID=2802975 RepID=A0ABN6DWP4_9BACT|nr:hypothetical protein [Desulfuromonas versatilis]BCR04548.1 hypothetical protein DESUT3_16170 [Desulfuromonas versatilis]